MGLNVPNGLLLLTLVVWGFTLLLTKKIDRSKALDTLGDAAKFVAAIYVLIYVALSTVAGLFGHITPLPQDDGALTFAMIYGGVIMLADSLRRKNENGDARI